jgi:hypothetical protein
MDEEAEEKGRSADQAHQNKIHPPLCLSVYPEAWMLDFTSQPQLPSIRASVDHEGCIRNYTGENSSQIDSQSSRDYLSHSIRFHYTSIHFHSIAQILQSSRRVPFQASLDQTCCSFPARRDSPYLPFPLLRSSCSYVNHSHLIRNTNHIQQPHILFQRENQRKRRKKEPQSHNSRHACNIIPTGSAIRAAAGHE